MQKSYSTPKDVEPDRDELTALRRRIHQHPELSHKEVETARLVAEKLKSFGYDVTDPWKATVAFQRRFRPDRIDGIVDGECRAKLLALLLPRPMGEM